MKTLVLAPASVFLRELGARPALSRPTLALTRGRSIAHSGSPRSPASVKQLTLVATIPGSSIAVLDGSVVSVALPSIQRDLGGGLASRQWISSAYLLTLRSLILLDDLAADGIPVLIAPDAANREGDLPAGKADATRGCDTCSRPISAAAYTAAARWLIEAVSEQTKHNRGMRQFRRRGRSAVRWELLLIAATHNLVKLHKQQLTLAAA